MTVLKRFFPQLPNIELAIVGEPTQMNLAIAEKGLLVIDGEMKGTPSHAAHPNDNNSIVKMHGRFAEYFKFQISKSFGLFG